MIVLGKSDGRLANRLMISAHALAHSIQNHESYLDLSFCAYAHYFSLKAKRNNFKIHIIRSRFFSVLWYNFFIHLYRILKKYTKLNFIDHYTVSWIHTELSELHRHNKSILLLEGTGFRNTQGIQIFKNEIKYLFTPRKKYLKIVNTILDKLQPEKSILVGVHIRKGDYRQWENGKYFFEDSVYRRIMTEFMSLFPKCIKIRFILCSDEKINIEQFKCFDIFSGEDNPIIDLYLLSRCNYIIGPPSSFSMWSSFIGNVPLFIIRDSTSSPALYLFKVSNL